LITPNRVSAVNYAVLFETNREIRKLDKIAAINLANAKTINEVAKIYNSYKKKLTVFHK